MPLLRVEEVNLHSSPLGHKTGNKTDEKYEAWVMRGNVQHHSVNNRINQENLSLESHLEHTPLPIFPRSWSHSLWPGVLNSHQSMEDHMQWVNFRKPFGFLGCLQQTLTLLVTYVHALP